jgi:hypothetical protein
MNRARAPRPDRHQHGASATACSQFGFGEVQVGTWILEVRPTGSHPANVHARGESATTPTPSSSRCGNALNARLDPTNWFRFILFLSGFGSKEVSSTVSNNTVITRKPKVPPVCVCVVGRCFTCLAFVICRVSCSRSRRLAAIGGLEGLLALSLLSVGSPASSPNEHHASLCI